MSNEVEVIVPEVGESITEVQIGQWLKNEGDAVTKDEDLVEIETEKASVHIPAPESGVLVSILKGNEEFSEVGAVIAKITPGAAPTTKKPASTSSPQSTDEAAPTAADDSIVMPAARVLMDQHGIPADEIHATGPGGRILKEDVQAAIDRRAAKPAATPAAPASPAPTPTPSHTQISTPRPARSEEIKPLSMIRRTIASRLVSAQQTAALLTTFNEVNMQPVMELRKKYKERFIEVHGVKLGFMSFFAKAAVEALRRYPAVNSEVRDNSLVMRHYQDIGIAIGGGKGLVVPVLRDVQDMSFAQVERTIGDFARAAGENRIQPSDLEGGTFTISNGGVYGSLLSTPIVNPPQSGILGLHSIQQRPMAVDGQVVILPMMYLALTYDHRVVDGREAVGFLRTIKETIEDPARLFLEV
ncbi:MAG: 2-oxoglutarate dehydrogenase complex dihydrolipoyllysine-residue succinyltransferase [Planctomycetota bacterium]